VFTSLVCLVLPLCVIVGGCESLDVNHFPHGQSTHTHTHTITNTHAHTSKLAGSAVITHCYTGLVLLRACLQPDF